jgi:3-oxoacyl-[acyl-carrier protein] reductase
MPNTRPGPSCRDRVALVSGATGQLGRSVALALAREGARVAVGFHRRRDEAEAVAGRIADRGGEAVALGADLFDPAECGKLVEEATARLGPIDICVVSPGGGWHTEPADRLPSGDALEDARRELAPFFHLMPLVLPGMYERRWGRIVGITVHPTELPPAYSYNVAKAARAAALRLAWEQAWKHRVTVNAIAPGPVVEIPSLEGVAAQCDHGREWEERESTSPQDIAEGIVFLCSEAGRFVTGCELTYLYASGE